MRLNAYLCFAFSEVGEGSDVKNILLLFNLMYKNFENFPFIVIQYYAISFRYQEIFFEIPEYFGNDSLWRKGKESEPKSLKLSVHKGPTEDMFAMATIDLDDIFDQV